MDSKKEKVIEKPSTQPELGLSDLNMMPSIKTALKAYLREAKIDLARSSGAVNGGWNMFHGESARTDESIHTGISVEKEGGPHLTALFRGKQLIKGTTVYWGRDHPLPSHVLYFYQRTYNDEREQPTEPADGVVQPTPKDPPYQKSTRSKDFYNQFEANKKTE